MTKGIKRVFSFVLVLILSLGLTVHVMAGSFGSVTNYELVIIKPGIMDISDDFTDPVFLQFVWEWLGNTGTPGYFTQKDITDKIASGDDALWVRDMGIKSLNGIEHFIGLKTLHCPGNKLKELPAQLPESLEVLYCRDNEIAALPELPPNIIQLRCDNNKLSALPKLPSGLSQLSCFGNIISELPSCLCPLHIRCSGNKLKTLIPPALISLYCGDNNLTDLGCCLTLYALDVHITR